jgi:hypothetical protein
MMQQSSCVCGLQQGRHQRNCSQSWPLFTRVYKHAARGPAQHLSHLSFADVARYHLLQDACSTVQRRPEVNAGGGGSMLENMPQPSNQACGALAELPTARLACSRRVAGADGDIPRLPNKARSAWRSSTWATVRRSPCRRRPARREDRLLPDPK